MHRVPCKNCKENLVQPGKICMVCQAAEHAWHKFIKRGGPFGPSSTYDNGFLDGVRWTKQFNRNGNG